MDWLGKLLSLPEEFLSSSGGHGGGVIQVRFDKYRQNESESRLKPKVKVEQIVNATVTIVKLLYGSAYVAEKVSSIRL